MTETIIDDAFDVQISFAFDLMKDGANALADLDVRWRAELFDFLNAYLVGPLGGEDLKTFLNTNTVFRANDPTHVVAGVSGPGNPMLFPKVKGGKSVGGFTGTAIVALEGFLMTATLPNPWPTTAGWLGSEYTCKKLVWDPKLEEWVWKYNYTLMEVNGGRLSGTQISAQFVAAMLASPNPPTVQELVLLKLVVPTYRLVCAASLAD